MVVAMVTEVMIMMAMVLVSVIVGSVIVIVSDFVSLKGDSPRGGGVFL